MRNPINRLIALALGGGWLVSDGFAGDSLGFKPNYLPAGKTAEQIAQEDGLKVQERW